jgi:hypothetical protein
VRSCLNDVEGWNNSQFLLYLCVFHTKHDCNRNRFVFLMLMEFYCLIAKCFWNHASEHSENTNGGKETTQWDRKGEKFLSFFYTSSYISNNKMLKFLYFVLPYATNSMISFCLTSTRLETFASFCSAICIFVLLFHFLFNFHIENV